LGENIKVLGFGLKTLKLFGKPSLKIYMFEVKILGYPEFPLRRLGNV